MALYETIYETTPMYLLLDSYDFLIQYILEITCKNKWEAILLKITSFLHNQITQHKAVVPSKNLLYEPWSSKGRALGWRLLCYVGNWDSGKRTGRASRTHPWIHWLGHKWAEFFGLLVHIFGSSGISGTRPKWPRNRNKRRSPRTVLVLLGFQTSFILI